MKFARRRSFGNNNNNNNSDEYSIESSELLTRSMPGLSIPPDSPPQKPLKSCLSVGKDLNKSTTTTTIKKNVSFHKIEINEHIRELGDNPSVTSGPALSIGWDRINNYIIDVEDYETKRPPRRCRSSLAIPSYIREDMLRKEAGISRSELNAANRERIKIRNSRISSAKSAYNNSNIKKLIPMKKLFTNLVKNNSKNAEIEKEVQILMERSMKAQQAKQALMERYYNNSDDDDKNNEIEKAKNVQEEEQEEEKAKEAEIKDDDNDKNNNNNNCEQVLQQQQIAGQRTSECIDDNNKNNKHAPCETSSTKLLLGSSPQLVNMVPSALLLTEKEEEEPPSFIPKVVETKRSHSSQSIEEWEF